MPSTVYKGDIAEVTFGHETGIVLSHGAFSGLKFTVTTTAGTDISTLTLAFSGSAPSASDALKYFVDEDANLKYPKGLLVGSKLHIKGGGAFSSDDHTRGLDYTIIDNGGTTIKVTPAMKTTTATVSTAGDEIIIGSLGTPTIDVGMNYAVNADASDETVLTDQFIGLAATIGLPETKTELLRSHVVGIGRDVVVQEPQRFSNEGGSLDTMMHSARWLYYALGNEAVAGNVTKTATVSSNGANVNTVAMGDTYISVANALDITAVTVGHYVVIVDDTEVLVTPNFDATVATSVQWGTGGGTDTLGTDFQTSERNEMRRVIAVDSTTDYKRIYVDDPFCFDHGATRPLYTIAYVDTSASGSPHFDSTAANYGDIDNRQSRLLWSMWQQPSFTIESSMRTRNVESYGTGGNTGQQSTNAPGSATDSKQLTRLYKGCKVHGWELTADADAQVKMKVEFNALMCYTDTGRLENGANTGDRFTAHRMFENIGNGPAERKMAGIAPNTEKPFFYYNGTITGFGTTIAQVTNFKLTGKNNTKTVYTVGSNPQAEPRNSTTGQSLEQIPFAGSRNPSLNIEGKVEYELDIDFIPTDPLLWHEFRTARSNNSSGDGPDDSIILHLVKNGKGAEREEIYVIIDDYIIIEAPLQIPEDKLQIKMPMKIMPKHVKIVAYDTLLHC